MLHYFSVEMASNPSPLLFVGFWVCVVGKRATCLPSPHKKKGEQDFREGLNMATTCSQWLSSVIASPAASALSGNLLEKQILWASPQCPAICFNKPLAILVHIKFENPCSRHIALAKIGVSQFCAVYSGKQGSGEGNKHPFQNGFLSEKY